MVFFNQNWTTIIDDSIVGGILEYGEKGKVVSVNNDWNYMILKINDKFFAEIEQLQKVMETEVPARVPSVTLMVKRGTDYGTLVTRAILSQLNMDDRLAILDIDPSYRSMEVEEGDVAFY